MTPTPTPRIRADVFPAVITLASPSTQPRTIDRARVVVTADQVLVFQDSPGGPALVFSERLASYTPPPRATQQKVGEPASRRQATLTTDSGVEAQFYRSGGCGCGSRLKAFNPFSVQTTYTSTRDNPAS